MNTTHNFHAPRHSRVDVHAPLAKRRSPHDGESVAYVVLVQ